MLRDNTRSHMHARKCTYRFCVSHACKPIQLLTVAYFTHYTQKLLSKVTFCASNINLHQLLSYRNKIFLRSQVSMSLFGLLSLIQTNRVKLRLDVTTSDQTHVNLKTCSSLISAFAAILASTSVPSTCTPDRCCYGLMCHVKSPFKSLWDLRALCMSTACVVDTDKSFCSAIIYHISTENQSSVCTSVV